MIAQDYYSNGIRCETCTRNPGCRFMPRELCVQYTYRNAPAVDHPDQLMRKCRTCGRTLAAECFPLEHGKPSTRCTTCTRDYMNAVKAKSRAKHEALETTIDELEKELAELKAQR